MVRQTATQRHDEGRSALVVYCVCAVYLYCVGALLAWAVLPVLTGLTPTLIVSGSMAPRINTGDVVLVGDVHGGEIETGNVVTFRDPGNPRRLLTHRVAGVNPDGSLQTRGDANGAFDSSAVPVKDVMGLGKVLVPGVGVPLMWVRTGAWMQLLMWTVGTGIALFYVRAFGRRVPQLVSWSTALRDPVVAPRAAATVVQPAGWESPVSLRPRLRLVTASGVVVVIALLAVMLPRVVASEAAFTASTKNPNNQFAAATAFCVAPGTHTLTPAADTEIRRDGTVSAGTNALLNVRSKNKSSDIRTLMRFDLPAAAGCVVTATLRLNLSAATTSRVLQVFNAPNTWEEGTAWSGVAEPAATPVTNVTPALGWVEIPVTDQVLAMYSGNNFGFLLKDQVEGEAGGGAGGNTQTFASSQAVDPAVRPQLVLNFAATDARPPAPSGLTATATSATRIALTWTDTAADETSYTVQRATSGGSDWTTIATLPADSTSYADTGLTSETAYDYRVRSTNAQGDSAWSNMASATTDAGPISPPAAPSDLAATTFSVSRIDLSWTDNSADEDTFTIERSPAGAATWTEVGSVGANVTTFSSTDLTANTSYDYRVRATHSGGSSDWSNTATATTATCATLSTKTLIIVEDTLVLESSPDINYGTDPVYFGVRSAAGSNARSLLHFPAIEVPDGCGVASAALQVHQATPAAGRVLEAAVVDEGWDETAATWTLHPEATGATVSVPSRSTSGFLEWDLTALIGPLGDGAPFGVMLRDTAESAATEANNYMSSSDVADPSLHPRLVITFG